MTDETKEPDADPGLAGTQSAMVRATRKALHEAKIRGELVPQWRGGKVVWVHPDEVELPPMEKKQPPRAGKAGDC